MNYRLIIFTLAIIFGVGFSLPTFLNIPDAKKINLGLDLQGGLYMLLGVKTNEAIKSKVKSMASSIKYYCDDEEIAIDFESLKVKDNKINFNLLDIEESSKLEKMLGEIKGIKFTKEKLTYNIEITPEEIVETKEFAILQAVDTIRNRLDQFGLAEPNVARQGEDKILVELPGIKSVDEEKRIRKLISKSAHLQLMAVDEKKIDQVYTLTEESAYSYGDLILEDAREPKQKHLVKELPILDGSMLVDARVGFDENNQPVINFTLNSQGGKIFGDFSQSNIGNRLAVVLDNKVYSAPVIRARITSNGQISGGFSLKEAQDVAIALRSGSLLAPVVLEEKRSVGPSLGADSIKASMIALISGFLAVMVFMLIYYSMAGVIANIALLANLFILIAIMALFGATLTVPGMAGIVLVIGMAVDANIIISERIRELLEQGHSMQKSIENGYNNAMSAILDSNITTLITTVVLYAYGTGPVKGFAVTMTIGILASMLTAILGTHGIYEYLFPKIKHSENVNFWFGIKVK